MKTSVLIIDDEDVFREDLAHLLRLRGYQCKTATNGSEGIACAKEWGPDVVFCDIVMPGIGGMDVLENIMRTCPQTCVIVITAYGSLSTAVEAFRKGAFDYIMKPLVVEDVVQKIQHIVDNKKLIQEVKHLRRELNQEVTNASMIGQSEVMKSVFDLISRVAPTRSTVLITGESGTGKELVARAIHSSSASKDLPFVAINCAGIQESLLESELFGHVKGAFTGAMGDKEGFFERAGEGTILLDEIGEMPMLLQAKLLRVLEEREFFRVGSTDAIPLGARILASTNKDPDELVKAGKMREDLFFRLAVFKMNLPPLRERRTDVPLLLEHFCKMYSKEMKKNVLSVDNEAMRYLMAYSWPGNARELRNVVERAIILCDEDCITCGDLPSEITGTTTRVESGSSLRDSVRAYEAEHIRRVLASCNGNKEETARVLGVNASTLHRKIAEIDMKTNH